MSSVCFFVVVVFVFFSLKCPSPEAVTSRRTFTHILCFHVGNRVFRVSSVLFSIVITSVGVKGADLVWGFYCRFPFCARGRPRSFIGDEPRHEKTGIRDLRPGKTQLQRLARVLKCPL